MTQVHRDLPDDELHEPKGIQSSTTSGEVIVSNGDGTSSVRKLSATELDDLPAASQLSGIFSDSNMSTTTIDVATEGFSDYYVGAATGQVVTIQLPPASAFTGETIAVKRADDNVGTGARVLIVPDGSEIIDSSTQLELYYQFNGVVIISNGVNWGILSSHIINSGWEQYSDSTYTSSSQLSILSGVQTKLTNDGLGAFTNRTQASSGTFFSWDVTTNKIRTRLVGCSSLYRLYFIAEPSAVDVSIEISFKIPGGISVAGEVVRLARGAGIRQAVTISVPVYADATTVANGLEIYLTPLNGNIDVDTINLMVTDLHVPRPSV